MPDCTIHSQAIPLYPLPLFRLPIPYPKKPRSHVVNRGGRVEEQGGRNKISQTEVWEKKKFEMDERFNI